MNRWMSPRLVACFVFFALFAGCSRGATPAPVDLEPRQGADPMNAVESYLREYQPGPLPRLFQTTRLYDRNGELLAEYIDEGRRTWIPINQVARELIDATIATEDSTFFANSGVDTVRIVGALVRNAQDGQITSGASTITMQLARNLFLGPDQRYDQSIDRKLLEAGLAQELTQVYSKAELLEMYLNLLNYGNLAYGPAAAAEIYFGKTAAELTLAQASYLAGIPQQPANLDPYRNFDATKRRQRIVLDLMVRHGYLTTAEADAAFAAPLDLQDNRALAANRAPHFTQYVMETLDRRFGIGYARRGGLQVTTTLDLRMQQVAEEVAANQVAIAEAQYDLSNAALVAMRPNSGEILVMMGSVDFDDPEIDGQVNVAIAPRQPGSAIKPILYAAALDANLISPATVLWDTPITYTVSANDIYQPRNYDDQFHGPVTVRTALANSYNVPTVKLLEGLTVARMLDVARAMGIRSLDQDPNWYGLSLTLGGGEVTLLDLTTAYHTLSSAGRYYPPQPILAIDDALQRPLFVEEPATPRPVLSEAAAFQLSDILSDNQARMPAFGANSPLALSRQAAVKTGTTTDWRDNWTVGYTRYLVAGVWAGNSDGRPMRNTSGITGAAPIWHEFMERVLASPDLLSTLEAAEDPTAWVFTPPATVVQEAVCPPNVSCRADGEYFSTAWLARMGTAGPLADSVTNVPSAPVYVQQGETGRLVGFCTINDAADDAVVRSVLRLPTASGIGVAQSAAVGNAPIVISEPLSETENGSGNNGTGTVVIPSVVTSTVDTPTLTTGQLQTVGWALRNSSALNFGPCDGLQTVVSQALSLTDQVDNLRVLVDLAAANLPTVEAVAGDGSVDVSALARAVTVDTGAIDQRLPGGGSYTLSGPMVHDNNCPGQYVMGRIINNSGAPVAGVSVQLRDEWGNEATAVSKSGTIDFGMFDFPIPSGAPHQLFITVLGDGGPASATYTIPHRQGEGGDASCHHLIFQGG